MAHPPGTLWAASDHPCRGQAGARPLPPRPARPPPGAGGGGHAGRPHRALRLQPPRVRELQLEGLCADDARAGGGPPPRRGPQAPPQRMEGAGKAWLGRGLLVLHAPSPHQPRIVAKLNVTSPDLFWLVFRYVNRGPASVSGHVSVREEGRSATCVNCECWGRPAPAPCTSLQPRLGPWVGGGPAYALALGYLSPSPARGGPWAGSRVSHSVSPGTEQSQPVTFPPSTEPAFVTVPQRGFGEPFVLNPGAWTLLVEAEGVLLVRWGLSGWGPGPGRGPVYRPHPLPARTMWFYFPAPTTRRPSCSCG